MAGQLRRQNSFDARNAHRIRRRHIAYEWFVPRTNAATNSCAALVLWLPEVLLSSSPQTIRSPEDALAQLFTRQAAMPLGESQLDYVDRLAEKLRRSLSVGRVRAVGVLGGDLYDKLILLRSLRSRFPGIRLRKLIKDETRGGYAPLLQDPALCAVVLPSGMFGIFVVLVRVLFEGV